MRRRLRQKAERRKLTNAATDLPASSLRRRGVLNLFFAKGFVQLHTCLAAVEKSAIRALLASTAADRAKREKYHAQLCRGSLPQTEVICGGFPHRFFVSEGLCRVRGVR
jgi:hypothetical protein